MNKPQMFSTDVFDAGSYVGSPDNVNKGEKRKSIQQKSDYSDGSHDAKKRCVDKQTLVETFSSQNLLKLDKFGQSSMFVKPPSNWTSFGASGSNNGSTGEVKSSDSSHSPTSHTVCETSSKDTKKIKGIEFVTTSI